MATRNAALIGRTNAQERRNVGSRAVERPAALQMTSIQTHEQSNGPASDAIAGEGPPSYMELETCHSLLHQLMKRLQKSELKIV